MRFYSQWIAEDIAESMAFWIPMTSDRARKIVSLMRRRVLETERDFPSLTREDAIEQVTEQVLEEIDRGEEEDPVLRGLTSP